jgi:CysZ protein
MAGPNPVLRPLTLAIGQLDDPAFVRVLLQSLALSALCFAAILAGMLWVVSQATVLPAWLAWIAGITGTIGASLLAFWLFLPMAAALGTLFIETIAGAVERRHYPGMPPGDAASLAVQGWDGIAVGLRVLVFSVVALVLALLLPGSGWCSPGRLRPMRSGAGCSLRWRCAGCRVWTPNCCTGGIAASC